MDPIDLADYAHLILKAVFEDSSMPFAAKTGSLGNAQVAHIVPTDKENFGETDLRKLADAFRQAGLKEFQAEETATPARAGQILSQAARNSNEAVFMCYQNGVMVLTYNPAPFSNMKAKIGAALKARFPQ